MGDSAAGGCSPLLKVLRVPFGELWQQGNPQALRFASAAAASCSRAHDSLANEAN